MRGYFHVEHILDSCEKPSNLFWYQIMGRANMFGSTKESAVDGFSRVILSRGTFTIPIVL